MSGSASHSGSAEFVEGLGHLTGRRWDAAVVCLRVAAQREPGRLAVVRALATAYLHSGEAGEATRALGAFTVEHPMSAEGWRLAAQLAWKLNQYDEAMAILGRGLERLPNSKALHRQMALFWGARGRLEESARHSECVDGAGADAAVEEGWLDRVARDAKLLESVIAAPAGEGDVEMLRALEARLAAVLEDQPGHADRQLALARLQLKLGALPAAMSSVRRALRVNPNYAEALRLQASLLGELGEFDAAVEILKGLIARGMDWADLHVQVAELQRRGGRAAEARSHLYTAIRLNPRFEGAKALLERCAA